MPELKITIPSDKLDKARDGFLELHPNVEMTEDEPPVLKYSTREWFEEAIRRWFVREVHRGSNSIDRRALSKDVDDTVATREE